MYWSTRGARTGCKRSSLVRTVCHIRTSTRTQLQTIIYACVWRLGFNARFDTSTMRPSQLAVRPLWPQAYPTKNAKGSWYGGQTKQLTNRPTDRPS